MLHLLVSQLVMPTDKLDREVYRQAKINMSAAVIPCTFLKEVKARNEEEIMMEHGGIPLRQEMLLVTRLEKIM